ncbi:MAG: hypothetical protein OEY93_00455 [Anaerolineae bacterium]|nr:hypothetical protein [Anaerolineae bacterium]
MKEKAILIFIVSSFLWGCSSSEVGILPTVFSPLSMQISTISSTLTLSPASTLLLPTETPTPIQTITLIPSSTSSPTMTPLAPLIFNKSGSHGYDRIGTDLLIYSSSRDNLLMEVELLKYYQDEELHVPIDLLSGGPNPEWSPNGRYLSIIGAIDGPSYDLYVFDTLDNDFIRLTDGPNHAMDMKWTLDSQWIIHSAYGYIGSGCPHESVWAASVDGNEVRLLFEPISGIRINEDFWIGPSKFYVLDSCFTEYGLYLVDLDQDEVIKVFEVESGILIDGFYDIDPKSGAMVFLPSLMNYDGLVFYEQGYYIVFPTWIGPRLLMPFDYKAEFNFLWDEDLGLFVLGEPCPDQTGKYVAVNPDGEMLCIEYDY